jgi:hypothetical protein
MRKQGSEQRQFAVMGACLEKAISGTRICQM